MSLFWKRKSVAPSTDSTTPILDTPISTEEAASLNSHPVLAVSNSTESSLLQSSSPQSPSVSLIDFTDDRKNTSLALPPTMTTATLGQTIHAALDSASENEKAQLTPTQQKRRSFFNFGKKKQQAEETTFKQSSTPTGVPPITTTSPTADNKDVGSGTNSTASPVSPVRSSHFGSQRLPKSTSPRLSTSSIFERNVQDPSLPPGSPSIPSHFSTENHIPAVLEATSLAITDSSVDPDSVEIVSSASHHSVLAHPESYSNPWAEESAHSGDESIGHGYASSLASADKRRLSFISFADVVQAENEQATHSTTNLEASHASHPPSQVAASLRSNSPIRTPPNPPHSPPGTGLGIADFSMEKDMSIPDSGSAAHSEVTVETLSQALRRHGSTDLKATMKSQQQQQNQAPTQQALPAGQDFDNPWRD